MATARNENETTRSLTPIADNGMLRECRPTREATATARRLEIKCSSRNRNGQ
jgi:hypothetical protein